VRKMQSQGAKLKLTGAFSFFSSEDKQPFFQLSADSRPDPRAPLSRHPPVTDDDQRLGYVVLDIRTMKQAALLYAPDGENPGKWMQLNSATFRGEKGTAVPELRVFAALREVQAEPGEFDAPAAAAATKINVRESVALSDSPEIGGDSPRASRAEPATASNDDDLAGIAKALGGDGDGERTEPLHLFSLTSEVRSFKSTRRMPVPTASVVVKLVLPAPLLDSVELGGRAPHSVAVPVRTNPPATVTRASEVTLQNGVGSVDFGAGVMGLAAVLAGAPRVCAEVWHKDKYAADQLLGTATVSLAPLLQEPVLDGYAPVMAAVDPDNAMNPRSATAAEHGGVVKVGELRMVLSLAEKGPLPAWASKMGGYDRFPLAASVTGPTQPVPHTPAAHNKHGPTMRASIERAAAMDKDSGGAAPTWSVGEALASQYTGVPTSAETAAAAQHAPEGIHRESVPGMAKSVADSMGGIEDLRKGREYAVAWELEVWKQAQEAKWTAHMRQKEAERMAVLEGEWRRREAQRESDHRRAREDTAVLEKKLAAAVAQVEERERKLIAAEESLSVRREAERREMAQRMSEAQHAVRRLQQECEHQLEMERGRGADVERQKKVLEERVEEANARAAAVERAFHGYKRAHLESSEATLHAEIARLQQQRSDAEQTAHEAVKSRDRFKTQIQKMAKQVVALERERTYLRAALSTVGGEREVRLPVGPAGGKPRPAPSRTDFMSDLFGGADENAAPRMGKNGQRTRGSVDNDDNFLQDFRDSIAALEAEAAEAERQGVPQGLARQNAAKAREDGEPWRPAGVSPAKPPKSPARSKSPGRSVRRSLAAETEEAQLSAKSPSALEQLRARRAAARKESPARERPDADPSWSYGSESGLKALFAEAEAEEASREAARAAQDASRERRSAAAAAEEEERSAPVEPVEPSPEPSPERPKQPVTAASLAEKRSLEKEVRRLVAERAELMATGAYTSSDRVVALIDEKIAELTKAVAR
jgi:centrosomal protein CEP120